MFVYINNKMEIVSSKDHKTVFDEYEKEQSKQKAIFKLKERRVEIVNSPLSFFEKEDIMLKEAFENKILETHPF